MLLGLNDAVAAERAEHAAHVALAVAAVVGAVVALFTEAQEPSPHTAVQSLGAASKPKGEAERRAVALSLGLEHGDLVDVARREPEAGRRRRR